MRVHFQRQPDQASRTVIGKTHQHRAPPRTAPNRPGSAQRKSFESAILDQDLIRVDTVSEQDNPLYWRLLHAQGKATGLPVLYNTSFNLFGDPLVCTPRDAVRSFYSSGIDTMFVGSFVLQK